jgi:K+-sensing histidine kinase KdpD
MFQRAKKVEIIEIKPNQVRERWKKKERERV